MAVMKFAFLIQILQYILFHNKFIRHFFHILSKCHYAAELYLPINLELLFHLKHLNMYNFKYWRNIGWFQQDFLCVLNSVCAENGEKPSY